MITFNANRKRCMMLPHAHGTNIATSTIMETTAANNFFEILLTRLLKTHRTPRLVQLFLHLSVILLP